MSVRHILSPSVSLTGLVLAALLLLLPLTHVSAATAPSLGAAASFAVLGGSTVTNTGSSVIIGDVGLWPGTSITGFPPGIVVPPGTIHATDVAASNAQGAVTTAYNALVSQPCDFGPFGPTDLAGANLVPGVYCYSSTVGLTGVLTLNGLATDVWVFKIGSALTTGPGSSVVGTGGDCNIFWQVTSSATLDTTTSFKGNIIALESISLNNGASDSGRLLARNGAVTLINNKVDATACGVPSGGVGVSKIFSPATISPGGITTLTITFTNTRPLATLQSDFTDNLPSGLVIADTPNLASTCGGSGAATATPGGSTVTLPAGRTIPGGTVSVPGHCTLTVDVTATLVGRYVNTLAVGALHTDKGNNLFIAGGAGVTLRVGGITTVGGEMLTIDQVRVLLPWLGLITIFSVIAVQTLVIRRRNKAH
jgi:uncharacterized repeat protein (TIGR01451 family)